MVLPDAVAQYIRRCPGVIVQKFRYQVPVATQCTPSSHVQMALPAVDALDLKSLQILGDVSTSTSQGQFVLPRYGAQMLIDSSSVTAGSYSIGGQQNQYQNVWNHICNEYSAGSTDQPKMSVYGGAQDVPPLSATAGTAGSFDVNGVYTPPALTTYASTTWSMSSQTNPVVSGTNQLASNGQYASGQPFIIEVFNPTIESLEPHYFPTRLCNNMFVDIGWGPANCLIGPASASGAVTNPSYTLANLQLQGTTYTLGNEFYQLTQQYLASGNVIECPFKNISAWPGSFSTSLDTQLNLSVQSQSVDMLVACFLDGNYRTWGPVVSGLNSSKFFQLGKGTGVRQLNFMINGQSQPAWGVTPKHAFGQTMSDLGMYTAGRGCYKNLSNYAGYLTRWFVWAMSTSMPFQEAMNRAISGLDTIGQNATLSFSCQSDPTNVAAGLEGTGAAAYSNIPLVFVVSTQTLLIGAGGSVAVNI